MKTIRIHIRNLLFNWGGHAASMLVMFFLSPFVVGQLDQVSYGIWGLLNVLTGYMGLFDIGVRSSVGRHVALYLGKGDERGVDETIRAGLGFFTLTGGLIVVGGLVVGLLFPHIFKEVPPEHFNTVRMLLPLMVVSIWLSALAAIYSSVLAAYDRFDIARGVDFAVLMVRTMGTVVTLKLGWGLWGLAISVLVGNALALIGNRFCAAIYHRTLRSWPFIYSRQRLKELINYGLASSVTRTSLMLIGQTDLIIVGAFLSVASVREYSVGAMLVYYSSTFLALITQTLFPAVQRSVASGKMGEAKHLFNRQLRLTLCFGLLTNLGMALYAQPFIRLWMLQDGFDNASVVASAGVMTLLAFSKLPQLYIQPCNALLAAMGHVRFTAVITLLEAVLNIALSIILAISFSWGLLGVAAGTLIARLLTSSIFIPVFLCQKIGIPMSRFALRSVLPGFCSSVLFLGISYYLITNWTPNSWNALVGQVALTSIVWCAIAGLILIPDDYRQQISARMRKFVSVFSVVN